VNQDITEGTDGEREENSVYESHLRCVARVKDRAKSNTVERTLLEHLYRAKIRN
jgi:hypothetical protein